MPRRALGLREPAKACSCCVYTSSLQLLSVQLKRVIDLIPHASANIPHCIEFGCQTLASGVQFGVILEAQRCVSCG